MRHIAIRSVWLIVLSLYAFAITRVVCIESVTLRNMMICDMSSDNDTSPAPFAALWTHARRHSRNAGFSVVFRPRFTRQSDTFMHHARAFIGRYCADIFLCCYILFTVWTFIKYSDLRNYYQCVRYICSANIACVHKPYSMLNVILKMPPIGYAAYTIPWDDGWTHDCTVIKFSPSAEFPSWFRGFTQFDIYIYIYSFQVRANLNAYPIILNSGYPWLIQHSWKHMWYLNGNPMFTICLLFVLI